MALPIQQSINSILQDVTRGQIAVQQAKSVALEKQAVEAARSAEAGRLSGEYEKYVSKAESQQLGSKERLKTQEKISSIVKEAEKFGGEEGGELYKLSAESDEATARYKYESGQKRFAQQEKLLGTEAATKRLNKYEEAMKKASESLKVAQEKLRMQRGNKK